MEENKNMEKIRCPEQIWGLRSVKRTLVKCVHELVSVRLPRPIDLNALAERITDCEYDPDVSKFVIVRTAWGSIQITSRSFQLQQVQDPNRIPLLCSFVSEALKSKAVFSFDEYLRSLGPEDLGIVEDFVDDLRQVKDDLLKPIKKMRK